jgi:hypothetical protein
MIGRITNGGFNIRSMPLSVAATGVGLAVSVGLGVGDGLVSGDADGDGDGWGVGVTATACRVKLAQGFGGTLAHRWWRPGGSPVKGFTWVVKLPLASATAPPATLLAGGSQMSVMDSLGRNAPPLTVICVVGSPAVTSSERNALVGVGVGIGLGEGVDGGVGVGVGEGEAEGDGDGDGDGESVGVGPGDGGVGLAATRRNHRGSVARTRNRFMRSPEG